MKAYLCKIMLRGGKPPFWWRCNIPSGISFSALSILLDRLIGEENSGLFSFEVYQFARIWEPSAGNPLQSTYSYSAYDAAHTAVDNLFEIGKPINYFRNGQEYQIRVESVDEKYPFDYPLVLKAPRGTDLNVFIKRMQDGFRFEDREMKRPKNKEQMLLLARNGVLRIPRVRKGLDEKSPYYKESTSLMFQSMMGQLRALIKDIGEITETSSDRKPDDKSSQYTMREILDFYNRSELEEIAKTHGIALHKKEPKEETVERIAKTLLDPDALYRHFACLTDDEIAAYEEVMNAGGILKITPEKEEVFTALIDTAYAFYSTEDLIILGTDIMDAYRRMDSPEFHIRRRKTSYLRKVLDEIVPIYYSMLPIRKFTRICRRTNDPQIQAEEVTELLAFIPESMHNCVIRDEMIYADQLIRDQESMEYVRSVQGDKPYYIIKEDEIDEILRYGYPYGKKAYRQFGEYLTKEMKVAPDVAEKALKKAHRLIALNYRVQKFFDMLREYDIIPTRKQAEEIMNLYMPLASNTRTMYNRGYTPTEMSRINGGSSPRNIRLDNADIAVRD